LAKTSFNLDNLPANHFITERIQAYQKLNPEETCLTLLDRHCESVEHLTWTDWIANARQVAAFLSSHNIKPKDRVIISLPNSLSMLSTFLGVLWLGAIPVPVPEPAPIKMQRAAGERFLQIIKDCEPKGIIVIDETKQQILSDNIMTVVPTPVPIWTWETIESTSVNMDLAKFKNPYQVKNTDIALLQYTSGSTGNPKGVIVTYDMLRANSWAMGEACRMNYNDRVLNWMPMYHDMGLIGGVLFPIYFKAKIFLLEPISFLAKPISWFKSIDKYKITLSTGPNFAYGLYAMRIDPNTPDLDISSWRLAFNGSEPVWPDTIERFNKKFSSIGFRQNTFYPVYGMAEATLGITFPKAGTPIILDSVKRSDIIKKKFAKPLSPKNKDAVTFVSVGKCLHEHNLYIIDPETRESLGERQIGEICFQGKSVSPGYYNKKNKNNKKRKMDLSKSSDNLLHTGDLGYLVKGNLYVVDRIKDLIQIAGVNYYPTDIEKQLESIEGLRSGRIVAFEVPDSKSHTGSFVIAAEKLPNYMEDDLKNKIKSVIYKSHQLIPKDIILNKTRFIPITSSGKIMRRKCRDLFMQNELG